MEESDESTGEVTGDDLTEDAVTRVSVLGSLPEPRQ